MKIVVASDSHGDSSALRRIFLAELDADLYLHAGDSLDTAASIYPFKGVRGNCDFGFEDEYGAKFKTSTPYGELLMQHYPLDDCDYHSLERQGIRIFIHGHTHEKEDKTVGSLYVFCPGSTSCPEDGDKGSYLVLDISPANVAYLFKNVPET